MNAQVINYSINNYNIACKSAYGNLLKGFDEVSSIDIIWCTNTIFFLILKKYYYFPIILKLLNIFDNIVSTLIFNLDITHRYENASCIMFKCNILGYKTHLLKNRYVTYQWCNVRVRKIADRTPWWTHPSSRRLHSAPVAVTRARTSSWIMPRMLYINCSGPTSRSGTLSKQEWEEER